MVAYEAFLAVLLLSAEVPEVMPRTLEFAGLTWAVRSGGGPPGNGCWSDADESVWVDEQDRLHLRVRRTETGWCQAEVKARGEARHGHHLFQLVTPPGPLIHELDPDVVVGLFLYRDDDREIDIELTRSFDPAFNGWHVVQQSGAAGAERHAFRFVASGTHTSHLIGWHPDRVEFTSYHGHCNEPPCGGIIARWEYAGHHNPPETDGLRPFLQLWINGEGQLDSEQEIIIASYRGPVARDGG